jgi:N-acetylmuramic acid 6-phosphate etherase
MPRPPRGGSRWSRLSTETAHPASARLDRLGVDRTIRLMQGEDRRVLRALSAARGRIAAAAEAWRETYAAGRTVWLFGAGTSGRLAVLEAAELPPTFGTDPRRVRAQIAGGKAAVFRAKEGAEDRADEGRRGAARARRGDLVVGVSASSVTPFVRGALEQGRRRGARTVLITSSRSVPRAIADIVVRLDTGAEVVAGSTRLKAATATKLALNQISTAAFAASGKVFGPWMIDLRAGSAKLKDRARRIVASAGGVSPAKAAALLAQAGGEVRTAIVMARGRVSVSEAKRRLAGSRGDVRRAIGM